MEFGQLRAKFKFRVNCSSRQSSRKSKPTAWESKTLRILGIFGNEVLASSLHHPLWYVAPYRRRHWDYEGFLKDSIKNSTLVSHRIKPSHTVSSQKLLQSSRSKVSFEYNSLWPLTEYLECFQNPCRFGSQYQKGWFHSEKPPEPPQKQRGVWLLKHKPGPTKDFQGLKRNKTT